MFQFIIMPKLLNLFYFVVNYFFNNQLQTKKSKMDNATSTIIMSSKVRMISSYKFSRCSMNNITFSLFIFTNISEKMSTMEGAYRSIGN